MSRDRSEEVVCRSLSRTLTNLSQCLRSDVWKGVGSL